MDRTVDDCFDDVSLVLLLAVGRQLRHRLSDQQKTRHKSVAMAGIFALERRADIAWLPAGHSWRVRTGRPAF